MALDTKRKLGGHLLLVPLAVDLGLGGYILDHESRGLFPGKGDSPKFQDGAENTAAS